MRACDICICAARARLLRAVRTIVPAAAL